MVVSILVAIVICLVALHGILRRSYFSPYVAQQRLVSPMKFVCRYVSLPGSREGCQLSLWPYLRVPISVSIGTKIGKKQIEPVVRLCERTGVYRLTVPYTRLDGDTLCECSERAFKSKWSVRDSPSNQLSVLESGFIFKL